MISHLLLHNFKSHLDTEVDFKPLTLITGVNNCGKSSILQSLLLLRQSNIKNRLHVGLDLNLPLVSLGTANDVLNRLSQSPILEIGLIDDSVKMDFAFNAENDLNNTFIPLDKKSNIFDQDTLNTHSLFNFDFQYLSADRWGGVSDYPSDSFSVNNEHQLSMENGKGELLGNFLYTYAHTEVYDYIKADGSTMPLIEQASIWESYISSNINIEVLAKDDKSGFTILYGTRGSENKKSIEGMKAKNVGFGVSYSLSMIIALLAAKPGSLILIENPEAHLHPDAISWLTKLVCLVSQRGVQVVIETHSDHIINGVLVNCKRFEDGEQGIDKNNVSIAFLSGKDDNHSSIVEEVRILDGGILDYQPKGFFDRFEADRKFIWE